METENNSSIDNPRHHSQPDRKKIQDYMYRFSDEIGKGNFSKVYKGVHQPTGKNVAIKTIELHSLNTTRLLELLNTETTIMKTLNHPNVIHCEQVLSSLRNCYIITQLCDGGDLDKKLKMAGQINEADLYGIAVDVYQGLKYLAEKHIIHRDLKVSNIFIQKGRYKIADFGFAQISQTQFQDISVGSPIYMSPEGYIQNVYGSKTDVWAFGILLFELACGRTPYHESKSQVQLKHKLEKQLTVSDFSSRINISTDLKSLIIECLNIDPKKRISVGEIQNTGWMKRAYSVIGESRQSRWGSEKQGLVNIRKISSLEQRSTMMNILKKNNAELLKKLENCPSANLCDHDEKRPSGKDPSRKFNSFLKTDDKPENKEERLSVKGVERRHMTLEKLQKKNDQIRGSANQKVDRNHTAVFYSPKNGLSKYTRFSNINKSKEHGINNLSDIPFTTPFHDSTNNHSIKNSQLFSKYESIEIRPQFESETERTEESTFNQPSNISSELKKNLSTYQNCQKNNLLNEYRRYFNNPKCHQGNRASDIRNYRNIEKKIHNIKNLSLKVDEADKENQRIRNSSELDTEVVKTIKKGKQNNSIRETGVAGVLERQINFSDFIGIIHYCRLSYKFSCLLDETKGEQSSKVFYRSWTVQILKEIRKKIKQSDILLGSQGPFTSNPSFGANSNNASSEKKKRLQDVIDEYLVRYTDPNCPSTHNYTLKEASNFTSDLYLRKVHEFKMRSKEKSPEQFFAIICYIKFLDKQTRNLMEYSYQVRRNMDGRAIEKLLNIKISDFNRNMVEEILGDGYGKPNDV